MNKEPLKVLLPRVGGLSTPSKMPTYGYSISAFECKVGSKLHRIKDTVCFDCYAHKGRYIFPNVQKAMKYRLKSLHENPFWEFDMAAIINRRKLTYFRWHDSGDLQGMWHLMKIIAVARMCPNCKFWLPTKENKLIATYKKTATFPKNLVVRVSNYVVNSYDSAQSFDHTSAVVTNWAYAKKGTYNCPSTKQDGKCMDCRACWDINIAVVNYLKH